MARANNSPEILWQALTSKGKALRGAALKLLSDIKYRHPFYWAGFVMIGDGNY
jgi:CHAT domain-containing protein